MRITNKSSILTLLVTLSLVGCGASKTNNRNLSSSTLSGQSPPAEIIYDQRAARDTIDWQAIGVDQQAPVTNPVERDWPGEEIGLIGPIIAMGGSGSKKYIAVYDPGGVFIGAVLVKEARKDPSRLDKLLALAQARGEIQNSRTLDIVSARRFLDMAIEAKREVRP